MTKYLEWDYDNPKHRSRRRRQLLPLEGEVLGPEPEVEPRIHVTVEHRHVNQRQPNILPRLVTIAAFVVLALILVRSPGALIMLAVLIPGHFWIAVAVVVAVLVIIAWRERRAGRDF